MKRIQGRLPRHGLGLLLGVGVLLAAVGAYAAIPGPDGVIHGCRHKQSGDLRVIDSAASCNGSTEVALNWSQTGAPGPSDAYSDYNESMHVGGSDTTLVSVEVPPGSYTVAAKTHMYSVPTDSFAVCDLVAGGEVIDGNINRLIAPANDQVVPFLGVAELPVGGVIELVCDSNGTDTVESDSTSLVATKVGTLH